MNFSITGHGTTVTSALHEYVVARMSHVLRNCTSVPTVEVVLTVEHHGKKNERHTALITVKADRKETIVRTKTTDNMYTSIKTAAECVEREILARKDLRIPVRKGLKKVAHNFVDRRTMKIPFNGVDQRRQMVVAA
jgi:ribosomal subunit interface protein